MKALHFCFEVLIKKPRQNTSPSIEMSYQEVFLLELGGVNADWDDEGGRVVQANADN